MWCTSNQVWNASNHEQYASTRCGALQPQFSHVQTVVESADKTHEALIAGPVRRCDGSEIFDRANSANATLNGCKYFFFFLYSPDSIG